MTTAPTSRNPHGPHNVHGRRRPRNPQQPSPMPSHRYRTVFDRVQVPDLARTWPEARTTVAPLWVPVDLRDGNQALAEPMDPERKRRLFTKMVEIGYKEIEVGYPSASDTDYAFVRELATSDLVPDDVTVVVFTPARSDLVARTVASIEGLPNVVVHMYTATAPTWRSVVLGRDRAALHAMILDSAAHIARAVGDDPGRRFEFSPEVFNLTEPDFVLEVCNSLTDLWDASPDRPVIHNLPATVEIATPNVYADQIEYMHRNLERRDDVILSVHPHNDRGTGVACAELAVLAGAERVEGCLFGNGERTGNVDLVTLALNLHAQGVDPMIDFSDIDALRRTVEHCNRIPVHDRHPYVGDLVYTAFSGTHQDAIRKGMSAHEAAAHSAGLTPAEASWSVPYLPIDPADVGRDYSAIIRVNSQSGKGGITHLLATGYGIELPRRLQIDFAARVQRDTDDSGQEVSAEQLWDLLRTEYGYRSGLGPWSVTRIAEETHPAGSDRLFATVDLPHADEERSVTFSDEEIAGDPASGLVTLLNRHGIDVEIVSRTEQFTSIEEEEKTVALVECSVDGHTSWGLGIHRSATAAALRAVVAAVDHARRLGTKSRIAETIASGRSSGMSV